MDKPRLRYEENHWSRINDPQKALEKYLGYYENAYNRTKAELIKKFLGKDLRGKNILDYGCGGGFVSVLCAKLGAKVTAVEAEKTAIQTARYYALKEKVSSQCEFINSDHFPEELLSRKFDTIIAKDILEHIEDDQMLLKHFAACQNIGGRIIITTQNKLSLNYLLEGSFNRVWLGNKNWCGWDTTHLRFYTPFSLKNKLKKSGYSPKKWSSVYIIPYNILTWVLLRRKKIEIPVLSYFDILLGRFFPFNRLGWNIIAFSVKQKNIASEQ